jgi:hypothetical protein
VKNPVVPQKLRKLTFIFVLLIVRNLAVKEMKKRLALLIAKRHVVHQVQNRLLRTTANQSVMNLAVKEKRKKLALLNVKKFAVR